MIHCPLMRELPVATPPRNVLFTSLLSAPAAPLWAQTYTAASCNQGDVNAVINGRTHTAVKGETIKIPAGPCTWTSGITVPSHIGISILLQICSSGPRLLIPFVEERRHLNTEDHYL
jgi:hypothetical protein